MKERLLFIVVIGIAAAGFLFLFTRTGQEVSPSVDIDEAIAVRQGRPAPQITETEIDLASLRQVLPLSEYKEIFQERSPFYKYRPPVEEVEEVVEEEVAPEPEPEKEEPKFSYKGRSKIGKKEIIILEDASTHEVYFVREGSPIGEYDYRLKEAGEAEIIITSSEGKEIIISTVEQQ